MSFQAGTLRVSPHDDAARKEFRHTIQKAIDRIHPPPPPPKNEEPIVISTLSNTLISSFEAIAPSTTTTISTLAVEDILGMDQMELEDLRREKAKWKLEKNLLWEKMVDLENTNRNLKKEKIDLECIIQQVVENSEKEVQRLENEVYSREIIPEFDMEKELMMFSEMVFTQSGGMADKYKNAAKECISKVQEYGESVVAICCSLWWYADTNQPVAYTIRMYIITTTNVYQADVRFVNFFGKVQIDGLCHSYQFDKPLIFEYCNIFKSFGHSIFKAVSRNGDSTEIFDAYNKKIESVIHSIPGTEYFPINGPWKRMHTPKGATIQYINTDSMEITSNPPYRNDPIKHN